MLTGDGLTKLAYQVIREPTEENQASYEAVLAELAQQGWHENNFDVETELALARMRDSLTR